MLIIIAAMSRNRVIGKNNELPWHFPADMKHFIDLTKGHPVIMGWNTFISILTGFVKRTGEARLLPGRQHFVLTSKTEQEIADALAELFPNFSLGDARQLLSFHNSLGNAVQRAETFDRQVYVIGGAKLYQEALKWADKIELTIIDADYEGDTYFPEFEGPNWELANEPVRPQPELAFHTYLRRGP